MISIYSTKKKSIKNDGIYITAEFRGLSTDVKGTTYKDENNNEFIIDNGSLFVEIDTGYVYLYDIVNQDWEVQTGGGSGSNLQNKSVTVTTNGTQNITPDTGYDGLSKVELTTNVQPDLESKSITITENTTTTITPSQDKDGISSVTVVTNVPQGITPTGTINITENGTVDVTNYASANVSVSGGADPSEYFEDSTLSGNLTYSVGIWATCIKKMELSISNARTSLYGFWRGYQGESLDLSNWNTSNITTFQACFGGSNFTSLNLSGWNTSSANSMFSMFTNCTNLTELNLSSFTINQSNFNCAQMFNGCTSLTKIDIRNMVFSSASISNSANMFGSNASSGVPDNCLIIVKDATEKAWVNTNFSRLTNVQTVADLS